MCLHHPASLFHSLSCSSLQAGSPLPPLLHPPPPPPSPLSPSPMLTSLRELHLSANQIARISPLQQDGADKEPTAARHVAFPKIIHLSLSKSHAGTQAHCVAQQVTRCRSQQGTPGCTDRNDRRPSCPSSLIHPSLLFFLVVSSTLMLHFYVLCTMHCIKAKGIVGDSPKVGQQVLLLLKASPA